MIRTAIAYAAVTVSLLAGLSVSAPYASAAPAVSATSLNFRVVVGPNDDQECNIVGDLYRPRLATQTTRVPAILTTNGFGGSKEDQAAVGREFARQGYVVLAYSGLGFGGSGCRIFLDHPDYDGKAARQLVSYLGGSDGIAFYDATHRRPAPRLTVVTQDQTDHQGNRAAHDPRVGMYGGSYGGQVQFAAAGVDPRIDAITPMATWSDLRYSLAPGNTDRTAGVSTRTPGAVKLIWANGFVANGAVVGFQHLQAAPGRMSGCPNFQPFICSTLASGDLRGDVSPDALARLYSASVASYVNKIRIPTLIVQGQADTLFNLSEGAANYQALKARGVPTQMVWYSGGHSGGKTPGEFNEDSPSRATQYVFNRINTWLDHYLKEKPVAPTPDFSYYRPWAAPRSPQSGAASAYGAAPAYPVPASITFTLSDRMLVDGASTRAGTQRFSTLPGGIPNSLSNLDVVKLALPEIEAPGTTARWGSARLTRPVDVVGSPTLSLKIDAPPTGRSALSEQLILFARIVDVAPNGTRTTVGNQIAPLRVTDPTTPITAHLPDIVHQFALGHRIELVISGGSINYRGGLRSIPVAITTGAANQTLTIPTVDR